MRRLLPPLIASSILLIVASACGSSEKTGFASGPGVNGRLLTLAVAQASARGDSEPVLIRIQRTGRFASLLLGLDKEASLIRLRVDSKTLKLTSLPPVEAPSVSGGTKAERALMLRIARSVGMGSPARIVIRKAGRSWHPHRPNAIVVNFLTSSLNNSESYWRATLAAVLFQRSADVQVIAYGYKGGSGRITGSVKVGSPISFAKELAFARRLISTVHEDGARVVSLTLARPVGLAVTITIETDQPASFLKHDRERILSMLDARAFPLPDVQVVDQKGEKVLENGGSYWVRPSLADCSPIIPWGILNSRPKPCPAK